MSDPMDRVSHINRSKTNMTKMQIQLSIEMRASLSEASDRLRMSQLAIIRAAIGSWLLDHGGLQAWDRPQDASSEAHEAPPRVEPGPEEAGAVEAT